MSSGNEEVLSIIDALKIKINVPRVLPTRKFLVLLCPLFDLYFFTIIVLDAKKTFIVKVWFIYFTFAVCQEKFRLNWTRR